MSAETTVGGGLAQTEVEAANGGTPSLAPPPGRAGPRPGPAPAVLQARAAQAYALQGRQSLEDKLILDHLPLVQHVAQKVAHHVSGPGRSNSAGRAWGVLDLEDLISAGTLGLVKAAKAFDPARHAEFKTYAFIRIRGAIIDELRKRTFVPPTVHNQVRRLQEAYRRLAGAQGRPPGDEELAAAMGLPVAKLYRVLEQARTQHFLSIHALSEERTVYECFVPVDGGPSPPAQAEHKEMLARLARAIRQLPQRDRLVLLLYYQRDLTMKEVAAVLEMTESRVSQLHAAALFKLSMRLKSQEPAND